MSGAGSEQAVECYVSLNQQETFDSICDFIKSRDKAKFSIQSVESPSKIVAYGGRGPSLVSKATYGMLTWGVATAIMHYGSPKRLAYIYIKPVSGVGTKITIRSEGWTDRDSRISTFTNGIMDILLPYIIDEKPPTKSSKDPMQILKTRFVNGEISKEEFEEMKKTLSD